jgi:hypothetical protein
LDENAVIHCVCRYLTEHGYIVEQRLHTTEKGVDIIAREQASGRRLYIEAKGATSSREGSARFDKGFNSTQVFDRVAKGLYTGLCLRSEHPDAANADVGLAFPDTPAFRRRLDPVLRAIMDSGLLLLLASDDGTVVRLS